MDQCDQWRVGERHGCRRSLDRGQQWPRTSGLRHDCRPDHLRDAAGIRFSSSLAGPVAATEPRTTGPGTTEPRTTGPGTTEPRTTGPGTAEPRTTGPGTTEPRTTGPGTTEPRTTGPRTTGPGTTEPGPAEPRSSGTC